MERGSYDEAILRLPGTAAEKQWLTEHLEVLSVRERIILSAAMAREPPQDMAGAVNCLLSLDEYEVRGHVGSYEALGEIFLFEQCVPQDQRAYFDMNALGQTYEEQHPGQFIGSCYVEYPSTQPVIAYDGHDLPQAEAEDWSVRLKLASETVPDGVWVKLPDYNEVNDDGPGDIRFALDELRVRTIQECTLLDAQCILPCVHNLADQYSDLADLIYDGQNMGFLLNEQGQVTEELSKQAWAKGGDAVKGCFDYAAYAAALAEQQGYQVTDDECYYIRKRDSPVLEQQTGMTMQ